MHASSCTACGKTSALPAASWAPHKRPGAASRNVRKRSIHDTDGDASATAAVGQPQGAVLSRRHAAAASLLAAAAWAAARNPAAAAVDESSKASFYAEWPYVSPSDILPYLRATATPGDVDSVLAAIDRFAQYYPMYR